ncbi:hypothetical protein B0H16DRAFT_1745941 [Mycena metata]|uniref:Uncharacterized protein n=1 Tax=Mycena metata TaxID=1033252 RepID=A0AAD7MBA2_9AGAR|nr:hypothetical protein B0H16DRAFT_1745941 [Mycena metata]
MLAKTKGIIIGSVPLYVLTGGESVAKGLDILVPASSEATMKIFLRSEFGYSLTDTNIHRGAHGTLRMKYTYQKGRKTIMLRVATGENPLVPLMFSETTLTMGFISAWGVFCGYPKLTLWRRGLLNHFTDDDHDEKTGKSYLRVTAAVNKFQNEGYNLSANPGQWQGPLHRCYTSAICTHTIRSLYDPSGLFVSFGVREHQRAYISHAIRYDDRYTVVWSLGGNFCHDPVLYHKAFSQSQRIYPRAMNPEEYPFEEDSEDE